MAKVKLTIVESKCRAGLHTPGQHFYIDDLCPPLCHELWQCIYPQVYVLKNGGDLDYGSTRAKSFQFRCPDQGRVLVVGEVIEEIED